MNIAEVSLNKEVNIQRKTQGNHSHEIKSKFISCKKKDYYHASATKVRWLTNDKLSLKKAKFNPVRLQKPFECLPSHVLVPSWTKSSSYFTSLHTAGELIMRDGALGVSVIIFCLPRKTIIISNVHGREKQKKLRKEK